jgi:hypothetical protein
MTFDRNSPWTEEREAELRRRWNAGESGGVIARGMQLTRNQVLGRVHRLGLEKRPAAVPKPDPDIIPLPKSRRAPPVPPARPQIVGSSKAGLGVERRREEARSEVAQLRPRADTPLRLDAAFASEAPAHQQPRGCRYITGSGTAWRYCQAVTGDGHPYCAEHALRCYRRATDPAEED